MKQSRQDPFKIAIRQKAMKSSNLQLHLKKGLIFMSCVCWNCSSIKLSENYLLSVIILVELDLSHPHFKMASIVLCEYIKFSWKWGQNLHPDKWIEYHFSAFLHCYILTLHFLVNFVQILQPRSNFTHPQ